MPRFKKKPVEIEAHQWFRNGDHPDDGQTTGYDLQTDSFQPIEGQVVRYYRTPDLDGEQACQHCGIIMHSHGWIDTLEGGHIVCPGDWIITGLIGERYPCKPHVFEESYEHLDGSPIL